jgi:MOSC domain
MGTYVSKEAMQAGLDHIRQSPTDGGTLELIVRRPAVDAREVLEEGALDLTVGLVGDTWSVRPSGRTPDGSPNPDGQLTLMNARAIALLAGSTDRWPLAGDQLYVDLDLSQVGLPPGSRLAIGDAVIEVTAEPHTGCKKFSARFGPEALRFVNIGAGKELNLRGRNAKVVTAGRVRRGDPIKRIGGESALRHA